MGKAVKSIKKSSKRSVEVDDESSDEEKFKNLKITKAANTSSDLNKSESSALNSSKDYAPIRNRKIKLKKKKKVLMTCQMFPVCWPSILARRLSEMNLMETYLSSLMISLMSNSFQHVCINTIFFIFVLESLNFMSKK